MASPDHSHPAGIMTANCQHITSQLHPSRQAALLIYGQGQINALPTGKERDNKYELGSIQRDLPHWQMRYLRQECLHTLQPQKQNVSGTSVTPLPSSRVFWRIFLVVWGFFYIYILHLKWLNIFFIFSLNTKTNSQNVQFKRHENLKMGPAGVRHAA